MSFDQAADEYIQTHPVKHRMRYQSELRDWIDWCDLNLIDPAAVRRIHIERWRTWLLDGRGLAPVTVSQRISTICSLYRYAFQEGVIPADPGENLKRGPRPRYATTRWLTRDQLPRLLTAACDGDRDVSAAVHILALNGLRLNELLALTVEDVGEHGAHTTLRLRHRKFHPGPQVLSVPAVTAEQIQALTATRRTGWLVRISRRHGGAAPSRRQPRDRAIGARFRSRLRELCDRAGVPQVTPHGLRHTFITLARDAGVPDRDVMASAGLTDSRMLAYYDRTSASVDRNAAHRLVDWLAINDE